MKELLVSLPADRSQIPDIFVNVYSSKTFSGEYRLGYIRVPAREVMRDEPSPQWYRLRSPYNEKTCPGILLMNLQYVWDSNTERYPKQRGVEVQHKLFA